MSALVHRDAPGWTERTLASLVSGAQTRVIVDLENDNSQINGVYIPKEDKIVLFKCKGDVPAVAVALEEAGHSLHRADYIRLEQRTLDIRGRLQQWHPQAQFLLDWLEDARVYNVLKEQYPGAAPELDNVFDLRRAGLEGTAWDTGKYTDPLTIGLAVRLHDVANEFLAICDLYRDGNVPTTFEAVLEYFENLLNGKPQDYPLPPHGAVLVVGTTSKKEWKLQPAPIRTGKLPLVALTVSIDEQTADGAGAGSGSDYPWFVIDCREVNP